MAVIDEQVVIHRPPQQVYDYASDLRRQASWERSIVSAEPVDGDWDAHEGMEIDYVLRAGVMKMHTHSRIIDLDSGHKATYEMTGPLGMVRGSYTCEPHPEGTLFIHHAETQPSGPLQGVVSAVATPLFRRQIRAGVEALRVQVEQQPQD